MKTFRLYDYVIYEGDVYQIFELIPVFDGEATTAKALLIGEGREIVVDIIELEVIKN